MHLTHSGLFSAPHIVFQKHNSTSAIPCHWVLGGIENQLAESSSHDGSFLITPFDYSFCWYTKYI